MSHKYTVECDTWPWRKFSLILMAAAVAVVTRTYVQCIIRSSLLIPTFRSWSGGLSDCRRIRSDIRIVNPSLTLVAGGNSLPSGSLPRPTKWDLTWSYANLSFRVRVPVFSFHAVGPSDYGACSPPLHSYLHHAVKNMASCLFRQAPEKERICSGTEKYRTIKIHVQFK